MDTATAQVPSRDTADRQQAGPPAFVWGYNARAGLGLGHTAEATTPMPLRLPDGTVEVQGGLTFTVARTRRGDLYAWGGNQHGQLGDGTTEHRWTPTKVKLPRGAVVTGMAVGTDHVIVCTAAGDVLAWGRNHRGQLGDGSVSDRSAPVVLRGVSKALAVAAGNGVSAAITRSGTVRAWGRNSFGQLGQGDSETPTQRSALAQSRPVTVSLPRGSYPVAVDAGHRHLAVALRDGRLLLAGLDAAGRPHEGTVTLKPSWGHPVAVSAGEDFTLVLTDRHILLAVGGNASGQLGVGDRANRLTPAVVTLPGARGRVTAIRTGARGAAALTSAGEVFTWGDGNVGQLGAGRAPEDRSPRSAPQRVTALTGAKVTGLGTGDHHLIAMVTRGPAVGLRLSPASTTVPPGRRVTYSAEGVDAFGTLTGPVDDITLSVSDGRVAGRTVSARTPGRHHVTARRGRLLGTATLIVKNGHR